jgi:hypothetical protein
LPDLPCRQIWARGEDSRPSISYPGHGGGAPASLRAAFAGLELSRCARSHGVTKCRDKLRRRRSSGKCSAKGQPTLCRASFLAPINSLSRSRPPLLCSTMCAPLLPRASSLARGSRPGNDGNFVIQKPAVAVTAAHFRQLCLRGSRTTACFRMNAELNYSKMQDSFVLYLVSCTRVYCR